MSTNLVIHDRQLQPVLDQLSLRSYADFVECKAGEVVARRGTCETRRILIGGDEPGEAVYLKVYRYEPSWRTMLMRDASTIESRNYATLRTRCGAAVPNVIATGRRRSLGRLRDAFILTRGIPNARPMDEWMEGCGAAARSRALGQLAELVSRMHASGFYHVDLQLRNVLVREGDDRELTLHVLDSSRGGLRRWSVRREYARFRDLSSLFKGARSRLTSREPLRWLKRYFGVGRLTPAHRMLARTILIDRRKKDHGPA